jgi:hypothetical protein
MHDALLDHTMELAEDEAFVLRIDRMIEDVLREAATSRSSFSEITLRFETTRDTLVDE